MSRRPRIVLLALDGFPLVHFGAAVTPNLWRLGQEGGYSRDGGRSGLPSTTYPGFASLFTGASPAGTGVRTTSRREGAVPGWAGSDRVLIPTLVHAAMDAGLQTAVVMGDHKLLSVLRLDSHPRAWPPAAAIPDGTGLDAHGYPVNEAVRPLALAGAADRDLDLLVVHFNETDTIGHDLGPAAPETRECARRADAIVGELLEALKPDWARTVVAVASDHDMARRLPLPPIDPTTARDCAGLASDWIADGCAAWVRLAPGADPHMAIDRFSSLHSIEAWRWRDPDSLLLLATPGRVFGGQMVPLSGIHGSRDTARTLAIVGGGHPAVETVSGWVSSRPPRLQDWAPTLADIMEVDLPDADGLDMLAVSQMRSAG